MESLIGFPGSVIARRGRVRDPFFTARVQAGSVEGFRAKRPSTEADARAMRFSRTQIGAALTSTTYPTALLPGHA